jgi:hypothetical protein
VFLARCHKQTMTQSITLDEFAGQIPTHALRTPSTQASKEIWFKAPLQRVKACLLEQCSTGISLWCAPLRSSRNERRSGPAEKLRWVKKRSVKNRSSPPDCFPMMSFARLAVEINPDRQLRRLDVQRSPTLRALDYVPKSCCRCVTNERVREAFPVNRRWSKPVSSNSFERAQDAS